MEAKRKFIIDVFFYGIIAVIVLLLCKYVLPILTPFIIALCVSAIVNAIIRKIPFKVEKLRKITGVLFCGLIYSIAFLLIILVGVKVVGEVASILKAIPRVFTNSILPLLENGANTLETAVVQYDTTLATWIDNMAATLLKNIGQFVTDFSGKAVVWVTSSATAIPSLVVDLVIMIISTFFMIIDFDKVWAFFKKLIPAKQRELMATSVHYTKTMVLVYIKSYSLLFLITFAELSIGFMLMKIPNAIVLALTIAVFDLMPILGTGGILLPWALVMAIMQNYVMAVGLLLLYMVIAGVRNTLEPKIVGKQIGLHPLATLVAMLLGLRLFGIVGMFAFPITLTVVNAMRRTKKPNEKGSEATAASA